MNDLIHKSQLQSGKRIVIIYKPTQKGIEFCRRAIEPYQRMFPRKKNPVLLLIMGSHHLVLKMQVMMVMSVIMVMDLAANLIKLLVIQIFV
jgi:hypothetical protein